MADQRYRCKRCGHIVYVKDEQTPPKYCPNCALVHMAGELEKM